MIINKETKEYQTRSDRPNENWMGEGWHFTPDGSDLAIKMMQYDPYYEFVLNDEGELIDVTPTERPSDPEPAPVTVLQQQLAETDYKIIKCSEYQLAGLGLPYDIAALHAERQVLRDQINALGDPMAANS